MRIDEVTNPLKTFLAQIRVQGSTARTTIQADSLSQARAMLAHVYGQVNVMSVTQMASMTSEISLSGKPTNETATIKPETPAQARVKSLGDQAANLKKQQKVARAQIGLKKAQARMAKANLPNNP